MPCMMNTLAFTLRASGTKFRSAQNALKLPVALSEPASSASRTGWHTSSGRPLT